MLSSGIPLDFHSEIYFVFAINSKYLCIGSNAQEFSVPSLSKKWLFSLKLPKSNVFSFLNSFSLY